MTETAPHVGDAVVRRVLPVLVAVVPAFAILTSKGVVIPVALAALILLLTRWRRPGRRDRALLLPLALVLWAVLSLAWSYDRLVSLDVVRLVVDAAMAAVLFREADAADSVAGKAILDYAGWGLLAAVASIGLIHLTWPHLPNEMFGGRHWLIKVKPAASIAAAMIWPVAAHVWRRRSPGLAAVLVGLSWAALAIGDSSTATLAVGIGAAVYLAALVRPRLTSRVLAAVVAAGILLGPGLAALPMKHVEDLHWLKTTAVHRLAIWDFVSGRIDERPILGWGFHTSRVIPGGKQTVAGIGEALPLHPHNMALQVRLELGLPGAALLAALLAAMAIGIGRWERVAAAGGLSAYVAALVVGMLSYGAWQHWWLASLAVIAVATRALGTAAGEDRP